MISILIAFIVSFIATIIILRTQNLHRSISGDLDFHGVQKFHYRAVPRIGGLAIGLGLFASITLSFLKRPEELFQILILISAIPTFAIGLAEDCTKKLSVKIRLLFTAFSGLLVCQYLNIQVTRLNIPIIDLVFNIPMVSTLFTILAITGLANAYNIIDGLHGLSSMVGMITLIALGYVGFKVGDPTIMSLSFSMAGAILGFFLFNYPRGLIFLGDGGAYLIGFWIAVITILLVKTHPKISPWFAIMINAYPVMETIFTIYRRKFHQGKSPGHPDGIHIHSLIFRRILNSKHITTELEWFDANSKTSPYLWVLSSLAVIPAVLFWNSTPILIGFLFMFICSYLWIYRRIVIFKTPKWLHI
jgi:UDP-N-acetylmuramyl pentapeptide phosphotransferase/UDP-N-acetylglucosamine-1-phosphate transferase